MSGDDRPGMGAIVWHDLTVSDAERVRDFYSEVVGWKHQPHAMGDYDDFVMTAPESEGTATGICHARGENAGLPPQWLMYVAVDDVAARAKRCVELGGKVIDGPRPMGEGQLCVIQDPAGAVCALIEA